MANGSAITKINVSTSKDEEEMRRANDYQLLNTDIGEGTGKNRIFIWYKKECGMNPVTRIQFSFNDCMKSGLTNAGYELVDENLNAGTVGESLSLWYYCGSTEHDIPIVDLKVTKDVQEDPALLLDGWERLGCNLNRTPGGGKFIYLWVKREKLSYICEITATVDFTSDKQNFDLGFTRVDEDANLGAAGAKKVFLWYCRTTDKSKALTALDVSINPQEETNLQGKGFKMLNVNLNEGTGGKNIFTWFTYKGCESQIKNMFLLVNRVAWTVYQKAGVTFINKNLNDGNKGQKMYLAYQ